MVFRKYLIALGFLISFNSFGQELQFSRVIDTIITVNIPIDGPLVDISTPFYGGSISPKAGKVFKVISSNFEKPSFSNLYGLSGSYCNNPSNDIQYHYIKLGMEIFDGTNSIIVDNVDAYDGTNHSFHNANSQGNNSTFWMNSESSINILFGINGTSPICIKGITGKLFLSIIEFNVE